MLAYFSKTLARIRLWLHGSPKAPPTIRAEGQSIAAGHYIFGNFIQIGPNADDMVAKLIAALDARGVTPTAERAGLEPQTIIKLAQRLKPDATLDFDQAVLELEHAVAIALDVIGRGERGASQDDFVNTVLARVAGKARAGDFDGGASTIEQALAELDRNHGKSRVVLLEEGVKLDILRRDAVAVVRRVESIIAEDHPNQRTSWLPEFRERLKRFFEEG